MPTGTSFPKTSLLLALSVVFTSGCASLSTQEERTQVNDQIISYENSINDLKNYNKALKEENDALKKASKEDQKRLSELLSVASTDSTFQDPKLGACYAWSLIPAKFETYTEKVVVHPELDRVDVKPAIYETVEERVLVQEATTQLRIIPASYRTVEERVLVQPATTRLATVDGEYETKLERILVQPAYKGWQKGTGPIQRIDPVTGEIMCYVEKPAVYRYVEKTIEIVPPTTKKVEVPAVYKTVTKRILDQPERTEEVLVPAKYAVLKTKKLIEEAEEVRVPANRYKEVEKKRLVEEEDMAWREVVCETNWNPPAVRKLQETLDNRGFNPGPYDGVVGPLTMSAVDAFRRDQGLPISKYIDIATIEKLGLKAPSLTQ